MTRSLKTRKRKIQEKSNPIIDKEAQARMEERWRSEEYAVTTKKMNHMLSHLGVKYDELVVDAFANMGNARVRVWFGPGGVVEDALKSVRPA